MGVFQWHFGEDVGAINKLPFEFQTFQGCEHIMLLIIGEYFEILHLVSVHKSGLCDNFDFVDGTDSYWNVWQFLSLNICGSNVDWAFIRANMFQLYQASIIAVSLILRKAFDIDNLRGAWGPFKTASWSCD